jgi:hypothetical protein
MADSPIDSSSSGTISPAPRGGRRLWPFVIVGLAFLGVIGGVGWWALAGSKFWTDGTAALHVNDNEARIREVVWTPPIPLTIFNTNDQEYEPSISPDGDELYFVRGKAGDPEPGHNADIYVSYRRMGAWTPAVPVDAVNSEYDDLGPRVTADGKFLLFYSNRPGGFGGYDIWAAPRLASDGTRPGGWGKPFNLGPGVNSEFDEYNPDPSPDGQRLFFATNRKAASREQKQAWRATIRAGTNADFDLWYAVRDPGAEAPLSAPTTNPATQPGVEALAATEPSNGTETGKSQAANPALAFSNPIEVPGINTSYAEGASCMSPAGDFLYFASDRPGGYGKFDIYRSRVGPDGTFGPVENLGPAINTSDNETDPQLALNGFRLYFSSDRHPGDSAAGPTTAPSAGSTSSPQASSQASPGQAPASEDGRYSLLQSDSREVYSVRAGHRLPHLGWSWLVLALSLLALVPLVMFMRKWDDQRLSLLQKCLLVSLLVHVLITLGLSMKKVTTDVIHYVRQEQGLEPPVDLTLTLNGPPGRGDDVGAAVRQQTSSDIPTASAPPAAVVQQLPGAEALEAPALPAGAQAAVPQAALGAPGVMIQVQAPKIETPKLNAAAQAPQVVPSITPQSPGLDLKIAAVPHLSQAEANQQIAPASAAPVTRVDPGQIGIEPKIDVPQVNAGEKSAPAAVQAGSMAESAVAARPAVPSVNVAGPKAAALPTDAKVAIETLRPVAAPVVSHAPEAPAVAEASNAAARQAAPAAIEAGAKPVSVQPAVPAAEAIAKSLASGAAPHAEPTPAEVAAGAASANKVVQPDAGPLAQVTNLTGPRTDLGKVSGTEAKAVAQSLPDVTRQAVAEANGAGTASAHPVDIAGASSKVPTAEAIAGSLADGAAPHALPTPAEVAAGAAASNKAVQPNAATVATVGDLAAPMNHPGKVSGTEAAAVAEAIAGIAKQGTANAPGESPASAANLPGAASKVPTAQARTDSLTQGAAPHASPAATAVATGKPAPMGPAVPANADLSVRPASQLPGAAAGPLASNRPDSPQPAEILAGASRAGDASGPGGPAVLPQLAVPTSAVPAGSGSAQSLASAPAPAGSAASGLLPNSPSVQPATSANLAAGPAVAAAPAAGGPKAVSSGQPDAPTAAEVAGALTRRGSPGATTQPTLADASLTGVAGAKVPTVARTAQSLAAAPNSGVADTLGRPGPTATPVTAGGVQSLAGNVDVASRVAGTIQRSAEAQPTATEASTAPAGPSARPGADVGATPLASAGPAGLSLPAQPAETDTSAAGVAQAVAPTTRPLDTSTAIAMAQGPNSTVGRVGDFAASPQVESPQSGAGPLAGLIETPVAARAGDVNAGPKKVDAGPLAGASGATAAVDPAAPPAIPAGIPGKAGAAAQSLASAATVSPREVVAGPAGRPAGAMMATPTVTVAGPTMALPKVAAAPPVAAPAAGAAASASGTPDVGSITVHRAQPTPAGDDGRPVPGVMLASAGVPGISAVPLTAGNDPAGKSLDSAASKTLTRTVSGPPVAAPEVTVAVPKLAAPESLFQRSPEQRKPLVEKRGGTPESEGAVERALAYLSRQQEPDGRWTVFNDDGKPGKRGQHPHDMACTGLATLAFLTADNTPAKEGPYRQTVTQSVDFLIGLEGPDGDLRGPKRFRGGGADEGNMYDQGICTMALCEAALMTGDRRYTEAALRAARFIVKAQNAEGGWRYTPAEAGDTSVLGWQMLALHDAEQLGFPVSDQTKLRADRYLKRVSQGRNKILASYLPGEGATSAMTAEALFSRLLLGDEITTPQTKEVCEFLTRDMPSSNSADFYFWYYASLSLSQMPDLIKADAQAGAHEANIAADAWKKWNTQTRDTLIKMQRKEGPTDGSWSDTRWGDRGGRVFSTSLACLTLEVYYRYLPLRAPADPDNNDAAPENDPRRAAAEIKASKPATGNSRTPARQRGKGWDDNGGHYPGVEPN